MVSELITIFVGVPGALSNVPDVGLGLLAIIDLPYGIGGYLVGTNTDKTISQWNGEKEWPSNGPAPVLVFPASLSNLPPGTVPAELSAGLGQANMVGGLSVPANWTVAAPEIRSVAMTSQLTKAGTAAAAPLDDSTSTFNQMGIGGMAGQAMAGNPAAAAGESGKPVTHARLTTRGPVTPSDGDVEVTPAPRTVVTGIAAAIRDIAKLRDRGQLTDQEYHEQKKRLLEYSIRHRPLG